LIIALSAYCDVEGTLFDESDIQQISNVEGLRGCTIHRGKICFERNIAIVS
jgi:PII-like signaling protein